MVARGGIRRRKGGPGRSKSHAFRCAGIPFRLAGTQRRPPRAIRTGSRLTRAPGKTADGGRSSSLDAKRGHFRRPAVDPGRRRAGGPDGAGLISRTPPRATQT